MRDAQTKALPTPAEFRKAMGHFPTGVCVVALEAEAGEILAMTINSFVSVSLDPLLICWSLHNSSGRFDLFANADRFTVSILAADQGELAVAYASRELKAVREHDFELSPQGLPVLKGTLASFECDAFAQHEAGDHTMILGRVVGLNGPPEAGAQALGFYGGEFIPVPADRRGD